MELSKEKIEAVKLYVQRLAPHRKPEVLESPGSIETSETLKPVGISKDEIVLVQALVRHLISPEGEYFILTQDTDNLPTFKQMVAKLRAKWNFRYDEILNVLEYHHDGKWQMCNENNLKTFLQNNNVSYKDTALMAWLGSDEIETYNPLKDYFDSLEPWDGFDWIGKLCTYIKIDEPKKDGERTEFFQSMLRKHLIRMLRQSFDYVENRYVLVFQSDKQKMGKSHFFRWINPLPKEYRHEISGNVKIDKDAKLPLTTSFTCLIDEIEMDKRNISDLKSVISIDSFNIRRPYAKNHESIPRMASFFGTCNGKNYLYDDNNARFLSFSVEDIDHNYDNYDSDKQAEVPKDKLWAQVLHLYKQGEKGKLTDEEEKLQTDINIEFASDSLVIQFAMKNYVLTDPSRLATDPYVITAYDFYKDFDSIHRGFTLSQVSKELRSLKDDNYTLSSIRKKKAGDTKKHTYINLRLK